MHLLRKILVTFGVFFSARELYQPTGPPKIQPIAAGLIEPLPQLTHKLYRDCGRGNNPSGEATARFGM